MGNQATETTGATGAIGATNSTEAAAAAGAAGASGAAETTGAAAAAGVAETTDATCKKVGGVRIRAVSIAIVVVACLVSVMFLQAARQTNDTYAEFVRETDSYIVCETAANDMKAGSNYLTIQIRSFVISHDVQYLDHYFTESLVTMRRDKAVAVLEDYLGDSAAHQYLKRSSEWSTELMQAEYYAAKLVLVATGQKANLGADVLDKVKLDAADQALSPDEQLALATDMVFGDSYHEYVDEIENNVVSCKNSLLGTINAEKEKNAAALDRLLVIQQVLTWALLLTTVAVILVVMLLMLRPVHEFAQLISQNRPLPVKGSHEMRIMAEGYNELYEENLKHNADLRRKAEHDHLTGLYNREVFERMLHAYRDEPFALMLVDLDYFKDVNDSIGHDGGDKALQKVARLLSEAFRATDYPCRLGGDEFAVIMTDMTPDLRHVVSAKVKIVNEGLANTSDGLPPLTLSIGVAFNREGLDYEQLYRDADAALYRVKEAGRNGLAFFE